MADVLVSFVAEPLFSIFFEDFISLAKEEIRLCVCVPKDLQKLKKTFKAIQAKLADAEKRQVKEILLKDLLEALKDVSYDADDILDEWKTEARRSEIYKSIAPAMNRLQVCNFFSPCLSFNQIAFYCKMGHEIKDIRERLEEIFQEMLRFNFPVHSAKGVRSEESTNVMEKWATGSMVDTLGIFGRNDNKRWLIDLLLNDSSNPQEKLSIISIYGMGGLGKTALAQLAYNDESVKDHFDIQMWVCVSTDFSPKRLTSAMIQSAKNEILTFTELEPFQDRLRQIVNLQKFLLVLDDVWFVDGEQWDKLKAPLAVGAEGSKIVVTTRKKKVAEKMGTTPTSILDLPTLSDDHCWSLLCHKALNGRSREECSRFEVIGREIIRKCQGLPLAIKAIGRDLNSNNTMQDWVKIKESEIWTNVKKDISPVLMLSYQDLPSHNLKQCFKYLSIFPKDYEIEKEKLIYMWMAQGYVLPEEGKEMEELGGSYFDDLLRRSLLQDSKIDDEGNIVTYKMHSLISDLAQSISGTECSIIDIAKMPIEASIKTRHSSFISTGNVESIPEAFCNNANILRTIIVCINKPNILKVPQDLLNKFIRLRVLDLSGSDLEEVSYSIENLKHLRYLDLSYTNIVKLPESMSSMCNLIFLRLIGCHGLYKLPDKMGETNCLRCLLTDSNASNFLPNGIGRIKSLVRLTFVVGDHQSKIGELKNLNLLQNLSIRCLERVVTADDTKEAALMEKRDLHTLQLLWNGAEDVEESEMRKQVEVLEGLQPYTNLTRLTIENYSGHKFPSWIGDQLFSTLTNVSLKECNKCEVLPPLGQLPSLKFLSFRGMKNVKCVGREFYGFGEVKGFPKLETLIIVGFEKLEEWDLRVVEEREIPSLLDLEIYHCPKLRSLPHLPSNLKSLRIRGCPLLIERCQEGGQDWNKIAHVQQRRID